MEINLREITVAELFDGYRDNEEEGVLGFAGRLNIRPKYQREFVYSNDKRLAVINTIQRNLPIGVMYWVDNGDDSFEVLDGQQRTLSICHYLSGVFSIGNRFFSNLTKEEQDQILDYKLLIYVSKGTDKEKLDWFTTINIAGEKLTDQELRNAVYTGPWLLDAKKLFSKTECVAYKLSNDYVKGSPIRQELLEEALSWVAYRDSISIEEYMAKSQHEKDASKLWTHYKGVIDWIETYFINYRKEMKGLKWGKLYADYSQNSYNPNDIEEATARLMKDEDVTNKKGIYEYILSGDEKYLNIRAFSERTKRETYEKQNGICLSCQNHFEIEQMEADHITPWHEGGQTISENCQMLCKACNRKKSGK